MNLQTELQTIIDGTIIEYGKIPSGLIDGWTGTVYYFLTSDAYDAEKHKKVVNVVIEQLESQIFDLWSEWRKTIGTVVWDEHCQITLVSFRVKDSY